VHDHKHTFGLTARIAMANTAACRLTQSLYFAVIRKALTSSISDGPKKAGFGQYLDQSPRDSNLPPSPDDYCTKIYWVRVKDLPSTVQVTE
jgi:hypothetical protein